jgi:hypothetical protein
MLYKIENIYNFFRYNLPRGIINLIKWFPIIWQDRDYDQVYICYILQYKLSLMEKFLREKGHCINSEKDAFNIKKCVILLDRIIKDEYHENVFKNHDKKWGEIKLSSKPYENDKEFHKLLISRKNVVTKEDEEQEKKEYRRLNKHEVELKNQDYKYLFYLMEKYIKHWWD